MVKLHPKYEDQFHMGWGISHTEGTINGDKIRIERNDEANGFKNDSDVMDYVCNMAQYLFEQGDVENQFMYALKSLYANRDVTEDWNLFKSKLTDQYDSKILDEIMSYSH